MNGIGITKEYYGHWLGDTTILTKDFHGIRWLSSPERNRVQEGYGQQFDLYLWVEPGRMVVSYGERLASTVAEIRGILLDVPTMAEVQQFLRERFGGKTQHFVKYVFVEAPEQATSGRLLKDEDYEAYEEFFLANNPNCKNIDWLWDYFQEMVQAGLCCGVFQGELLLSCTDAPTMPHIPEMVQEIGINTRGEFRGKRYASDAVTTCIRQILKNGKYPQWSTAMSNLPSQKLAERVGFRKLAEVFTVTL